MPTNEVVLLVFSDNEHDPRRGADGQPELQRLRAEPRPGHDEGHTVLRESGLQQPAWPAERRGHPDQQGPHGEKRHRKRLPGENHP